MSQQNEVKANRYFFFPDNTIRGQFGAVFSEPRHLKHFTEEDYKTAIKVIDVSAYNSLKEENDRLKKLNKLLNDIIEATPCDPDITTEQDVAWEEYRKALAGGQDEEKKD